MKKAHLEEKYRLIREDYNKLYAEGLRHEVVAKKLAKKYFYAVATIEKIVWENGTYAPPKPKELEDKNQISLF